MVGGRKPLAAQCVTLQWADAEARSPTTGECIASSPVSQSDGGSASPASKDSDNARRTLRCLGLMKCGPICAIAAVPKTDRVLNSIHSYSETVFAGGHVRTTTTTTTTMSQFSQASYNSTHSLPNAACTRILDPSLQASVSFRKMKSIPLFSAEVLLESRNSMGTRPLMRVSPRSVKRPTSCRDY